MEQIEHADMVIGSRYIPGGSTPNWSWGRRMISGFGNLFVHIVLPELSSVHDCTAGFRCYRRHVLESLGLDTVKSLGYGFQVELTYRTHKYGFKIVETPIVFMDRRVGKSKMSRAIVLEAFTFVLRARFKKLPPPVQPDTVSLPPISTPPAPFAEAPYVEQEPAGKK